MHIQNATSTLFEARLGGLDSLSSFVLKKKKKSVPIANMNNVRRISPHNVRDLLTRTEVKRTLN